MFQPLPSASVTAKLVICTVETCAWALSVTVGSAGSAGAVLNESPQAVLDSISAAWIVAAAAPASTRRRLREAVTLRRCRDRCGVESVEQLCGGDRLVGGGGRDRDGGGFAAVMADEGVLKVG